MSNRNGIKSNDSLDSCLTSRWNSFVRRIAQCHIPDSRRNGNYEEQSGVPTIVSLRFIINSDGEIMMWSKPKCTHLEPSGTSNLAILMKELSNE